jgi:translation initiation factor IF-2
VRKATTNPDTKPSTRATQYVHARVNTRATLDEVGETTQADDTETNTPRESRAVHAQFVEHESDRNGHQDDRQQNSANAKREFEGVEHHSANGAEGLHVREETKDSRDDQKNDPNIALVALP